MAKKLILLLGFIVFISACVVTSPSELFQATPTMCVECAQATICAENMTGDPCPAGLTTPAQEAATPTVVSATETPIVVYPKTKTPETTPVITETEEGIPTENPTETKEPGTQAATAQPEINQEIPSDLSTVSPMPALATPTVYLTQTGDWLYKAQAGSPKYTKNFVHPKLQCSWSGIAGQVFGPGGVPQPDVVVMVSGDAKGTPVSELGYTGTAPGYGENGYEIELPTGPVNTTDSMMIQLFDLQGNELSMRYVFDTYIDCKKALIIYNFVQAN
jgi:hypothetical protein